VFHSSSAVGNKFITVQSVYKRKKAVLHSSSVVGNEFSIAQTVYKRRKAIPQHPNEDSTKK
jgi:hypothetical protein